MAVKIFTSEALLSSELNANFADYTDHRDSSIDPHGANLTVSESITTPLITNDTDVVVDAVLDASIGLVIPSGNAVPSSTETQTLLYFCTTNAKLYVYRTTTNLWVAIN